MCKCRDAMRGSHELAAPPQPRKFCEFVRVIPVTIGVLERANSADDVDAVAGVIGGLRSSGWGRSGGDRDGRR